MVDPFTAVGLATGIIGLLPICANGFTFIEGICKAHGGVANQVIRIRGQRSILRGWGKTWDVPLDDNEPNHSEKLQRWIEEEPERGSNVQETLCAISDIFADTKNIEKNYGVVIKRRNVNLHKLNIKDMLDGRMNKVIREQDVTVISNHMNMVMRCDFQLRGKSKFATLVERLKEFVDNLLKTCSEVQAQRIENAILKELSSNDNPDHLKSISKVYEQEVVDRKKAGQRYQGYELMKEVAAFKARVQDLSEKRAEETAKRRASQRTTAFLLSTCFLCEDDFRFSYPERGSQESTLTLATVDRLDALRYIEWKSYKDSDGRENSDYESHILELADFLGLQGRPAAFQVLPCVGIFRNEVHSRFGFVFEPPSYISKLGPEKEVGKDGELESRTPVTLLDLMRQEPIIEGRPSILPLGDRFHLARKLAQTLYVIHTMGWVHKNIRSSSVIFVPAESTYGVIPSMRSGAKDLANPFLGGFGFSRPQATGLPDKSIGFEHITLDCYHHPSKRFHPEKPYLQAFDLYSYVQYPLLNLAVLTHQRHLKRTNQNSSEFRVTFVKASADRMLSNSLGTVLLEIGLWQSLGSLRPDFESADLKFENEIDVFRFHKRLTEIAEVELPGKMGSIYAEAVIECLISRSNDSDLYTQERLCWKVNAALDQCMA